MQPEKVSEGKLSDTDEEDDCEKDEDVSEEGTRAKKQTNKIFTLKKLSEVFHDIESTKDEG